MSTAFETLNPQALRVAVDHWNRGDLEQYLRLYADEVIIHGYGGPEPGLPSVRHLYEAWWQAFPGSQLVLDDTIAVGDKVACRFRIAGKHEGPFQGLAPSGRQVSVVGFTILRFVDGKCVERWSLVDSMGLLSQIGAGP
jgi:predicted ester cyclase